MDMAAKKPKSQLTVPINLTLDPESLRILNALTKKWACSRSAVVRRILREATEST